MHITTLQYASWIMVHRTLHDMKFTWITNLNLFNGTLFCSMPYFLYCISLSTWFVRIWINFESVLPNQIQFGNEFNWFVFVAFHYFFLSFNIFDFRILIKCKYGFGCGIDWTEKPGKLSLLLLNNSPGE